MASGLATILIFHNAGAASWSLAPGSWYLQRRRRLRIPSAERRPAGAARARWARAQGASS